jgi:GWxTD domain-containing protein
VRGLLLLTFIPILGLSTVAWTVRPEERKSFFATPVVFEVSTAPQSTAPTPVTPVATPAMPTAPPQAKAPQVDESALSKWIEKDVPDVATPQERDAFQSLRTDEERNQFIESFWFRRDPTPGTLQNEFRDEYYRRIALANEKYTTSRIPGWKTDRGRILIMHGEPDEVKHGGGGAYIPDRDGRPGVRISYLSEQWRYRFIEGIGADVILEFIDLQGDGTYTLQGQSDRVSPVPASLEATPQKQ